MRRVMSAAHLIESGTMTTKKTTIAGKEVTLAYCYATEIAFRKYTGVSIDSFNAEDPEHVLYIIIASILAWCQANGTESDVKDEDIIYRAKPKELVDTLTVIFDLRREWYEIPAEDAKKDKEPEEREKKD